MTTATLSALPALLVSSRVLYHVFDDALHHVCLLESLTTETHLQPYHVTPMLQLFTLHPDPVDLGDLGPVLNDLGPQSAVAHTSKGIAYMFGCWEVRFQHPHCFIGERLDLLGPIVRSRV